VRPTAFGIALPLTPISKAPCKQPRRLQNVLNLVHQAVFVNIYFRRRTSRRLHRGHHSRRFTVRRWCVTFTSVSVHSVLSRPSLSVSSHRFCVVGSLAMSASVANAFRAGRFTSFRCFLHHHASRCLLRRLPLSSLPTSVPRHFSWSRGLLVQCLKCLKGTTTFPNAGAREAKSQGAGLLNIASLHTVRVSAARELFVESSRIQARANQNRAILPGAARPRLEGLNVGQSTLPM